MREVRDQRDRMKAQKAQLELAGTTLGNIMGVKREEIEGDKETSKVDDSGELEDYKSTSQFAQHLQKSEAVSDFARSKTIKQQRQFLPVSIVRFFYFFFTTFCFIL